MIDRNEISCIYLRANAATAGPWQSYMELRDQLVGSDFISTAGDDIYLYGVSEHYQDFLAAARTLIPRLAEKLLQGEPADTDDIERLRDITEKALRDPWVDIVCHDRVAAKYPALRTDLGSFYVEEAAYSDRAFMEHALEDATILLNAYLADEWPHKVMPWRGIDEGKANLIRRIIAYGKAAAVRDLIEGESEFTTDRSTGVPEVHAERKAWIMSVHHLRFVAEFGDLPSAEKDGRYLSPYPDDFERWLRFGAPGIAKEDIEDYLAQNPL